MPGREFTTIDVLLEHEGTGTVVLETTAFTDGDYLSGERVGVLPGGFGTATLTVTLRDTDGEVLDGRISGLELAREGRSGVTVVITRDCKGVMCPEASAPRATACLGGECVDPRCSPETPEFCPPPRCALASDCDPPAVACAGSRCEDGTCLVAPDDGRCAAGEICDPDLGCVDAACTPDRPESCPECMTGSDCGDPPEGCVVDACVDGRCVPEARDALCPPGETCDLERGCLDLVTVVVTGDDGYAGAYRVGVGIEIFGEVANIGTQEIASCSAPCESCEGTCHPRTGCDDERGPERYEWERAAMSTNEVIFAGWGGDSLSGFLGYVEYGGERSLTSAEWDFCITGASPPMPGRTLGDGMFASLVAGCDAGGWRDGSGMLSDFRNTCCRDWVFETCPDASRPDHIPPTARWLWVDADGDYLNAPGVFLFRARLPGT